MPAIDKGLMMASPITSQDLTGPDRIEELIADFRTSGMVPFYHPRDLGLFINTLCSHPEISHVGIVLETNFKAFLAKQPPRSHIQKSLLDLMKKLPSTVNDATWASYIPYIAENYCADFITKINQSSKAVLFLAHRPYFIIAKEAKALKEAGYSTFLLSVETSAEHITKDLLQSFDAILEASESSQLTHYVLTQTRPQVIHVQCWMWSYYLADFALNHPNKPKVVCEFYDITSLYAPRDSLCTLWHRESVDLDINMEDKILHHCDVVIHRFPQHVAEKWFEEHQASPENYRILPYAAQSKVHYDDRKRHLLNNKINMVYAGGLVPKHPDYPEHLFPEITMAETFRDLARQGICVDVLHDPHKKIDRSTLAYQEFYRYCDQYPELRLVNGVVQELLPRRLAQYDFGILLFRFNTETSQLRDIQCDGVIATKIFAYLEAGLPVIVNAEYGEMARLIRDNGLGLAIFSDQIDHLAEILADFDHASALENIQKFNRTHNWEEESQRVIALYDRLVAQSD